MEKIIAIGPREQDFLYTNHLFSGSITLYGRNQNGNKSYCGTKKRRINHNVFSDDQKDFIDQEMMREIIDYPDVQFMSYDPNLVFDCDEQIINRTLCLNDKDLMNKLNNKITFRSWSSQICRTLHSDLLHGKECTFQKLIQKYGAQKAFVVQAAFASGGEGTFILTADNYCETEPLFLNDSLYLVSVYQTENIPLNIHALIYDHDILLFPVSIQIMQFHKNKLLFQGSDFVAVRQIDQYALDDFKNSAHNICLKLQSEGYRGITGIDGMIVNGESLILEMNNRFQGSTLLLNLALKDAGLPSTQELNYESFEKPCPSCRVDGLDISYSFFTYIADGDGKIPVTHKRGFTQEPFFFQSFGDGLDYSLPLAPYSTLERVVFKTNIVSITPKQSVALHPNIPDMDADWVEKITNKNVLCTKIALINQGVVITSQAEAYLRANGGMREGVHNAVDIYFDDIVINSAVNVKLSKLSPFIVKYENAGLILYLCEQPISKITIQKEDALGSQFTAGGTKVKDICLLATDRLRVQHSRNCYFKHCATGCDFCEADDHEFSFGMQDIYEAVNMYIDSEYEFRHFLIGGRSDSPKREAEEILSIVTHIRSRGNWPIYVMCIPPYDRKVLDKFYNAGVTEIAFNIEIWDPCLAKKWMPGKGSIPRERYLQFLQYATALWGKTGNVRSCFVVGLEDKESLFSGIEQVCRVGAAPILSVFRPIPGTKGNDIAPPTNDELLEIYMHAQDICNSYNLSLGPDCIPCQNNTLSLPEEYRECSKNEGLY